MSSNNTDLIEWRIDFFDQVEDAEKLVETAKKLRQVMSNHDFDKTPATSELERRLTLIKTFGADIAKIAVMPNSARDVLNLLLATDNMKYKLNCPLITMAMGDLGKVTRISGEVFGSCLTFGTVGNASAPGQIESTNLKGILNTLKLD